LLGKSEEGEIFLKELQEVKDLYEKNGIEQYPQLVMGMISNSITKGINCTLFKKQLNLFYKIDPNFINYQTPFSLNCKEPASYQNLKEFYYFMLEKGSINSMHFLSRIFLEKREDHEGIKEIYANINKYLIDNPNAIASYKFYFFMSVLDYNPEMFEGLFKTDDKDLINAFFEYLSDSIENMPGIKGVQKKYSRSFRTARLICSEVNSKIEKTLSQDEILFKLINSMESFIISHAERCNEFLHLPKFYEILKENLPYIDTIEYKEKVNSLISDYNNQVSAYNKGKMKRYQLPHL
jgi:hypothetical protein